MNVSDALSHDLIDTILVGIVVFDLLLVLVGRMATAIRLSAWQSVLVAALPLLVADSPFSGHILGMAGSLFALRVVILPRILTWSIRHTTSRAETPSLIGFGWMLTISAALVAASFYLGWKLTLPPEIPIFSGLLVPAAFSTILLGLMMLVTRSQALTQVIAYLTVENGIYLFGLALIRETPVLVETGILLDIFVGVFVMGIIIFHINRTFEHVDTTKLGSLRD